MGMLDKVKFWKKDDEFSDLSNLGDFGLDDKSGGGPGGGLGGGMDDLGGGLGGDFPAFGESEKPGMTPGVPTHIEEVHPTEISKDMGDKLGLGSAQPSQQPRQMAASAAPAAQPSPATQSYPAQQPAYQQQAYAAPQQYSQQPDLSDLAKDIEIIHAKLDAIKSSLDSINQRLATLERMAGGGEQKRYTW